MTTRCVLKQTTKSRFTLSNGDIEHLACSIGEEGGKGGGDASTAWAGSEAVLKIATLLSGRVTELVIPGTQLRQARRGGTSWTPGHPSVGSEKPESTCTIIFQVPRCQALRRR